MLETRGNCLPAAVIPENSPQQKTHACPRHFSGLMTKVFVLNTLMRAEIPAGPRRRVDPRWARLCILWSLALSLTLRAHTHTHTHTHTRTHVFRTTRVVWVGSRPRHSKAKEAPTPFLCRPKAVNSISTQERRRVPAICWHIVRLYAGI